MASRIWKIRESYGDRKSGMDYDTPEEQEAYECGYEEGYEAAMKELSMGERYGMRGGDYQPMMGMGERHHMMGERRGRDSMGRYR